MRKLILTGLVLSAAATSAPGPAAAQQKAWCSNESGFTRECYWDTQEQCAETKQHLMGGSCFRNPFFQGPQAGSAAGAPRVRAHHTPPKKRSDTADR
jgi:hypothetical protein